MSIVPKISRSASTTLSYALSILVIPMLVALTVLMPRILHLYVQMVHMPQAASPSSLPDQIPLFLWIAVYLGIAIAYAADGAMLMLLHRIRHDQVFTAPNVACLRLLSWCCFGEAGCFFCLGVYFRFSFAVAFAAFFIGVALRVVKNVMEEATALKTENDFTI